MADYVCLACGYEGKRRILKQGSKGMEIFMWTVLLVPGPFYTAWRIMTRRISCPNCGKDTMVKTTSERGITYLYEQEKLLDGVKNEDLKRF